MPVNEKSPQPDELTGDSATVVAGEGFEPSTSGLSDSLVLDRVTIAGGQVLALASVLSRVEMASGGVDR